MLKGGSYNKNGHVVVCLGDLGTIPYPEQEHWAYYALHSESEKLALATPPSNYHYSVKELIKLADILKRTYEVYQDRHKNLFFKDLKLGEKFLLDLHLHIPITNEDLNGFNTLIVNLYNIFNDRRFKEKELPKDFKDCLKEVKWLRNNLSNAHPELDIDNIDKIQNKKIDSNKNLEKFLYRDKEINFDRIKNIYTFKICDKEVNSNERKEIAIIIVEQLIRVMEDHIESNKYNF